VESTIIRRVETTAMLVARLEETFSQDLASRLERAGVQVVPAGQVSVACDHIAAAMPQIVVVVGTLRRDEHEALSDRAMAVGAAILYVDPRADEDATDAFVERAARAALERKLRRDESVPGLVNTAPPAALDTMPPAREFADALLEATTAPPPAVTFPPGVVTAPPGAITAPPTALPDSESLVGTQAPKTTVPDPMAAAMTTRPDEPEEEDVDSGWGEST